MSATRNFPLGWKRTYWPEPKLGRRAPRWEFRPARRAKARTRGKAALLALV